MKIKPIFHNITLTSMTYIAEDSIKVALGIGKLLFGGHSSKSLHCSICPKDRFIKATYFDLAVYQVSFHAKT